MSVIDLRLPCGKWPGQSSFDFRIAILQSLQIQNLESKSLYIKGLNLVVLTHTDAADSIELLSKLAKLNSDIFAKYGRKLNICILNNYIPFNCLIPPCNGDCSNNIGSCKLGDQRLNQNNWIKPFQEKSMFRFIQDIRAENIWDKLQGKKNDMYIYDDDGFLISYLPRHGHNSGSKSLNGPSTLSADILTPDGYENIYTTILSIINYDHHHVSSNCQQKSIQRLLLINSSTNASTDNSNSQNTLLPVVVADPGLVVNYILLGGALIIGFLLLATLFFCRKKKPTHSPGRNGPKFVELSTVDDADPEMDDELHGTLLARLSGKRESKSFAH